MLFVILPRVPCPLPSFPVARRGGFVGLPLSNGSQYAVVIIIVIIIIIIIVIIIIIIIVIVAIVINTNIHFLLVSDSLHSFFIGPYYSSACLFFVSSFKNFSG
jgi:hypothetical protein